ncbi:MAG: type 4a pilus biogenesis protein PilO [Planctomycetota bacterium]|jgi:septal ring factor EnvC (AmiA/AmiB activator)
MTPAPAKTRSLPLAPQAIGSAVIAAISLAAFLIVVGPAQRMGSERAAMERELEELQRRTEELDQTSAGLEDELEGIEQQLAASEIQLQSSRYLNARIAHIIDHAGKGEVAIHETRPGTVRDHRRYQAVPILLAGRGSYSDCAAFLHQLHESLPDTGVVEFELTGRPDDTRAPASFRFNLVWYAGPVAAGGP